MREANADVIPLLRVVQRANPGDFWANLGKILFTGLVGVAAIDPEGPSMAKLARWVFTQDQPGTDEVSEVVTILNAQADSKQEEMKVAAAAAALHLHAIWSKDERLVASVEGLYSKRRELPRKPATAFPAGREALSSIRSAQAPSQE